MKYFVFYFFWVFIFCDDIDILTNYKLKYKYLESCDNFLSECYTNSLLIISNFENGKYSYNTKKVYENSNDKFSLIISEAYYYKGLFVNDK